MKAAARIGVGVAGMLGLATSAAAVNRGLSPIILLDIWRVEQRLKYLGFPAMGFGNPTLANNTIQDFTVDGVWGNKESYAVHLFDGVVNYNPNARQLATPTGRYVSGVWKKAADRTTYFNALDAAANDVLITQGGANHIAEWLNAYNAPHWMNIGAQMGSSALSGWQNNQRHTNTLPNSTEKTNKDVETYGTSWMRDLMAATQYAPAGLASGKDFGFNGAVDANHGATPFMHGTHDLGMAFDLDLNQFINEFNRTHGSATPNITLLSNSWNLVNAVNWTQDNLPHDVDSDNVGVNNQRDALRQFLQLYALSADSGTRTALMTHIVNGTDKNVVLQALFGNGTQTSGMVSQVHIGGAGTSQNSYANMRAILDALGVTNSNVATHHNHFHIYLAPPTPIGITANLLADTAVAEGNQEGIPADILAAAQALLAQYQNNPDEEVQMFIADVPYIPVQEAPLVVADATAAQKPAQKYDRVIGVCHLSVNPYDPTSAVNSMSVADEAVWYLKEEDRYKIEGQAKVSVLKMPEHGQLRDGGKGNYSYLPEKGFLGNDSATLLVEVGGKKVRMEYFFRVMQSIPQQYEDEPPVEEQGYCPEKARVWKISSTTDTNGNTILAVVDLQSSVTGTASTFTTDATLASWINAAQLDGKVADMSGITFADLPGSAVGQTVGNSITLDTSAAGHGWYVDANPWDNSEYLATSNPYEWVAKDGTAAYGKMDLLSVLLHEYGHALGIEHSMDSHNYMGTTLTPGVRRLPSAEELALMQQLVGQVKEGMVANASTLSPSPSPASGGGE